MKDYTTKELLKFLNTDKYRYVLCRAEDYLNSLSEVEIQFGDYKVVQMIPFYYEHSFGLYVKYLVEINI